MFKRKIISGTVDSLETVDIKLYGTGNITYKTVQAVTDNVCNSLLDLLNSCGVQDCKYDSEHCWLYVMGIPLTVVVNPKGYCNIYSPKDRYSINGDVSTATSEEGIMIIKDKNVGSHYNCSVTFVGEPDNAFMLVFTFDNENYTTFVSSGHAIEFFHLTEQMETNEAIGIKRNNTKTIAIYRKNPDGNAEEMTEVYTYFDYTDINIDYLPLTDYGNSTQTKVTSLYEQDKVLLVPWYTDSYLFRVNDCFIWNSIFNQIPQKTAYNPLNPLIMVIGGEKYMLYNNDVPFLLKLSEEE